MTVSSTIQGEVAVFSSEIRQAEEKSWDYVFLFRFRGGWNSSVEKECLKAVKVRSIPRPEAVHSIVQFVQENCTSKLFCSELYRRGKFIFNDCSGILIKGSQRYSDIGSEVRSSPRAPQNPVSRRLLICKATSTSSGVCFA